MMMFNKFKSISLVCFCKYLFVGMLIFINISALAKNSISLLKNDYELIFFYSSHCHYCKKFEPVLRRYLDSYNLPIRVFAIGSTKSNYFPQNEILMRKIWKEEKAEKIKEVVEQFFGSRAKVSVPALFILNKQTLHAYPVSQGALTYFELKKRMDELIPRILRNESVQAIAGIKSYNRLKTN